MRPELAQLNPDAALEREPDLFDPRYLARRTDPETSVRAAVKSGEFRARHRALIWNALIERGPMTYREIAAATRLEPVAVNRRAKEMQHDGLVTIGPDTREGMRIWRGLK